MPVLSPHEATLIDQERKGMNIRKVSLRKVCNFFKQGAHKPEDQVIREAF